MAAGRCKHYGVVKTFKYSPIICCDWGTTSFRIRILDAYSRKLLFEHSNKDGAAHVFNKWHGGHESSSFSRQEFYLSHLNERIEDLTERTEIKLSEAVVLISGMAASSIGMLELPYASVPFALTGKDATVRRIENNKIGMDVYLISGVSNGRDIMRGEETQLVGLNAMDCSMFERDTMCILPGTHSKHVYIRNGALEYFKTFMTGEIFSLLHEHSILKAGSDLNINPKELTSPDVACFIAGVQRSRKDNLLHSLFTVRINKVLSGTSDRENYLFLSGLLIGSELNVLTGSKGPITLCSTSNVYYLYAQALNVLGLSEQTTFLPPEKMENAYWEGQLKIFDHFIATKPIG
jgi:2-dehydro-3-deoxygalactonokinase